MLFGIPLITAKQLVTAITTQDSVQTVILRHARTVIGWYRRGIAKRLIKNFSDLWNGCNDIIWGYIVFMMIGREMARRNSCIFHFIITLRCKTDRIGLRRFSSDFTEYACNG